SFERRMRSFATWIPGPTDESGNPGRQTSEDQRDPERVPGVSQPAPLGPDVQKPTTKNEKQCGLRWVASRPLQSAPPWACWPRLDCFAAQPAVQVFGDVLPGRITLSRLLLQTLEADDFQVARYLGI